MNIGRVLSGMGLLIMLYLFLKYGTAFNSIISSVGGFVQGETAVLQGNAVPNNVKGTGGVGINLNLGSLLS